MSCATGGKFMAAGNRVTEPGENEEDESGILANQDETNPGEVNDDDAVMGAGPTDLMESDREDFLRGDVDVKDQMDRASRVMDFPNRANLQVPKV
jgi:hypothetical protein